MLVLDHVRSALFLPASNARALAKARKLACDMVVIDLEDAVADEAKDAARAALLVAINEDWGERVLAVRINAPDSPWHDADVAALAGLPGVDVIALPKVDDPAATAALGDRLSKPLLAMIETPAGLYAAREIAQVVSGLILGPNDLSAALRLPPDSGRTGLALAYQMVVLAARAAGIVAFDGVYNRFEDPDGFEADCRAGRLAGFDGKSLIHPSQIEAANRLFGPSPEQIEEAQALVQAFTGGAERFRGRMIEAMHVAAAHRIIARA